MFLVLPLLAVLAAAPLAPQPPQKGFDDVARQAASARDADKLSEAIVLYREGVRQRPSWQDGWWSLGRILYEQDRFPEAQVAFLRFVAITPKPGPAWAYLGLCEYETKDFAHSMESIQRWAKEGFPGSDDLIVVARFHWALLLTQKGDFGNALHLLEGVAVKRGESMVLIEAMGLASLRIPSLPEDYPAERREQVWLAGKVTYYASTLDLAQAQTYSTQLLAEYGKLPEVHFLVGSLLNFQLKPAEAAVEFQKELQISPRHISAMLKLAQIDLESSKLTEAETLARNSVAIEARNPETHLTLGRVLLVAGQVKEAALEFEAAERLAPNSSVIHFNLSTAYQRLGEKAQAEREIAIYKSIAKDEAARIQSMKDKAAQSSQEAPK
jgi:tetratricopeptide (TPR) repeat protein